MNGLSDRKFAWWYAFLGSLGAVFAALALTVGDGTTVGVAARVGVLLCGVAISLLLVSERWSDIQGWLRDHIVARRLLKALALTAVLSAGIAVGQFALSVGDAPARRAPAGYAIQIGAVFDGLELKRKRVERQLSEATASGGQSSLATSLGQAFKRAAGELGVIDPPPMAHRANARIAEALTVVSQAYIGLGRAVLNPMGSQEKLDSAGTRVRQAYRRLWREQKTLARAGYAIVLDQKGRSRRIP